MVDTYMKDEKNERRIDQLDAFLIASWLTKIYKLKAVCHCVPSAVGR
jgi:hypothetical protein